MNIASTVISADALLDSRLGNDPFIRKGTLQLLAIKDSDIRILTLEQARDAVDNGVHSGGAFSAAIPLVALFYGGFIRLDIVDPTRLGQDMFVLSKGHAVALLASIYADLGYFDRSLLANSRSYESTLNGHPGPLLAGVHISTGPMGQGLAVAQGFAIAGKRSPSFDSYCMVGDGELQEGTIWETVMFAAQQGLDNLCVLVDRNHGQLDVHDRTVFPMPDVEAVFRSFGWNAVTVDASGYEGVHEALAAFRFAPRNGKPTAIVCSCRKGQGAFSQELDKHKITLNKKLAAQEIAMQERQRSERSSEFLSFYNSLAALPDRERVRAALLKIAERMRLVVRESGERACGVNPIVLPPLTRRVPRRDKRIRYDASLLPQLDTKKEYAASDIVTGVMKVLARDPAVVSIDADLGSTSGLQPGVSAVDQTRALNTGVAEANMMNIGEAFAALGYNAWVSTFCPFFNWQVLRRIAVGQQERLESMQDENGWLTDGHGLDLTFLATAANFDTRVNGATHMGNDDSLFFDAMAQLRIIDVSCPQQMLAIMRWIAEGNRGLLYVRIMRAGSPVIYPADYDFTFGKADVVREGRNDRAVIVTSGRQVHEGIAAAALCAEKGVGVRVVDMHSIDESLLLNLYQSGLPLFIAEQNNGYIWQNFLKALYRHRRELSGTDLKGVEAINTLAPDGRPQFIHSATYEQLLTAFGLAPSDLAERILARVDQAPGSNPAR
jgi:transketolase